MRYLRGMHYASVENLTKSFGARTLFTDISFHIEEGNKVAFVARNGSGKSTLLQIIAGRTPADAGSVWVHKDVKVILLQQETRLDGEGTIWDNIMSLDNPLIRLIRAYETMLEKPHQEASGLGLLADRITEAGAWNLEASLRQILGKLNLHQLNVPVKQLSGGQVKRVALARALIEARLHEGKCLLILDEPTNHLDIGMIEWLEGYLTTGKSTLLLVTHDRYFLDGVCNEILEIDNGQLFTYKGNYEYFLEQKSLRLEVQQSELQKDRNIYRKELEWMRKQPRARTTKSKSRQDAFGVLENKVSRQEEFRDVSLQVKMTRLGGKVLEMKKVYKSYGDKVLLKGFDYTFKKGERVGMVGKNGSGKSTFLKVALGEVPPDSGKINHGETVVFGNYSQEGLQYGEDKRAIEFVKDLAEFFPLSDGSKISASQFMEKFGFSAQQQFTPLSKLSGGEKRRLHLLSILYRNPNFLVLDEPTNDLDLETLRTLEEFLKDFPGCLLIVSHDRYFMDRLVDHLFAFEGDGVIRDFPGNYSQYRAWQREQELADDAADTATPPAAAVAEAAVTGPPVPAAKKITFREKLEFEQLEKEIAALEQEKRDLQRRLGEGSLGYSDLHEATARIGEILFLLDGKEMRWLELSEKM